LDNPIFREVVRRFWQEPNILVFAWAGLGLPVAVAWVARRAGPAAARARGWGVAAGAGALVGAPLLARWREADQAATAAFHDLAKAILEPLPPNALFLAGSDIDFNAVRYLQLCEKVRPEVPVLPRALLLRPWITRAAQVEYPRVQFPGNAHTVRDPRGYTF